MIGMATVVSVVNAQQEAESVPNISLSLQNWNKGLRADGEVSGFRVLGSRNKFFIFFVEKRVLIREPASSFLRKEAGVDTCHACLSSDKLHLGMVVDFQP